MCDEGETAAGLCQGLCLWVQEEFGLDLRAPRMCRLRWLEAGMPCDQSRYAEQCEPFGCRSRPDIWCHGHPWLDSFDRCFAGGWLLRGRPGVVQPLWGCCSLCEEEEAAAELRKGLSLGVHEEFDLALRAPRVCSCGWLEADMPCGQSLEAEQCTGRAHLNTWPLLSLPGFGESGVLWLFSGVGGRSWRAFAEAPHPPPRAGSAMLSACGRQWSLRQPFS